MDQHDGIPEAQRSGPDSDPVRSIAQALTGLKFGSLLVIVQDGVIVQIERTEKIRLRVGKQR